MNHPLNEVTGWEAGVLALQQVGGVLLTPDAANALSLALTLTVTPWVKADVLADIADDASELADLHWSEGEPTWYALTNFALALDTASAMTREALTR